MRLVNICFLPRIRYHHGKPRFPHEIDSWNTKRFTRELAGIFTSVDKRVSDPWGNVR